MSDPTTPASEAAAAPSVPAPIVPAAPPAPPAPAAVSALPAPAVEARRLNPYASKPAPVAAQPASAAPSAPAADPRVDGLMEAFCATVAQTRDALPSNVIAAVRAMAPDTDPVAQSRAINALRANGLAAAPVAMPANTAPSAPSPAPSAAAQSDAAIFATYEQLRKAAPIRAQVYRAQHGDAIARASRTAS